MITALYRLLTMLSGPLIGIYLERRKAAGKEDPKRFAERLGVAGLARPEGPMIWIHAASVGESLSLLSLIERMTGERAGFHVLMTTGTVTSARLMADRLPEGILHQYVPVDRVPYVRRFLDHWRPDLILWAESEFWPNLICETAATGAPLILVNGRISPQSFKGWRRLPSVIRHLLSKFSLCLAQTDEDADRLRRLGAAPVVCAGNLKFAAPPLPADAGELESLKQAVSDRPNWLAASTHPGEEEIASRVHRRLTEDHSNPLTIIVPRHPERGAEIESKLARGGVRVARRAAHAELGPDVDVYIADTMGELGLFFRLSGVVFMGKSLVPLGGQNVLEPARLDCAIVYGPHMANFREIAERMEQAGASERVADPDALASAVARLLEDDTARGRLAERARSLAEGEAEVLDVVMGELEPFLESLSNGGNSRAGA